MSLFGLYFFICKKQLQNYDSFSAVGFRKKILNCKILTNSAQKVFGRRRLLLLRNITSKNHGYLVRHISIMDTAGLRNLKDFLLQYNKISESCFLNCVNHLSERSLSQDECGCVDMCTKKHVSVNHKVMQVYMEIQPLLINKRIQEMNKQQEALSEAQKEEAESSQSVGVPSLDKDRVEDGQEVKKLKKIKPRSDLPDKEVTWTEYL